MLIPAACIILVTSAAWLFGICFHEIDLSFSESLLSMFPDSHKQQLWLSSQGTDRASLIGLGRLGMDGSMATLALVASLKSSRSGRWLTMVQVLALGLIVEILLLNWSIPISNPVSMSLAVLGGSLTGWLTRYIEDIENQILAHRDEIMLRNSELEASRLQLIKSDEVERRTLAGDLHDQVLNDLKIVRQRLQNESLSQSDSELDLLLARSMDGVREVMDTLSPAVLEHLGFLAAVEDCIRKGAERAGYKVRFRSDLTAEHFRSFTPTELTLLYRIVQETVNNICKHANATRVRCLITSIDGRTHITVADNGRGIAVEDRDVSSRGLDYMNQRASIISANIDWRVPEKGSGTVVDISI